MPSSTFSVTGGVIKLSLAHHEQVACGALGHMAVFVQQNGFVKAARRASSLASALLA